MENNEMQLLWQHFQEFKNTIQSWQDEYIHVNTYIKANIDMQWKLYSI